METVELSVGAEERCACGNLIAVLRPGRVEILCRRCKRIHLIPLVKEDRPSPGTKG